MKIFTVAEMVAAEKAADAGGTTYAAMMETAGRAVAEAITAVIPVSGRRVLILVGPGNNGGDGLVAGRYLAAAGAEVAFYLFRPRDPETDSNLAQVMAANIPLFEAPADQRFRVLRTRLRNSDIIIDALLGTGVARPISGPLAKLMQQLHAGLKERAAPDIPTPFLVSTAELPSPTTALPTPFIVAVDCPSGLNCDTGALDKLALPAQLTISFAGPKHGHFRFPGAGAVGRLLVADIGIAESLPEVAAVATILVTAAQARAWLPDRPLSGHKGRFGSVLIAAGCHTYWGAPVLAARAAYRAGAGLVALAIPADIRPAAATQLPEATYPAIPDRTWLGQQAARWLHHEATDYQAAVIGPGLGDAKHFLAGCFPPSPATSLPIPLLIDADGLNWLAEQASWWQHLPPHCVLTPHPGEMARLMKRSVAEIKQEDPVQLARRQAAAWNQIILLKGAYSVIAHPDGRCARLPFAHPALAVAGSGDVLAGVIGALLGQGIPPFEAAALGGYLHAAAGIKSANAPAGLLASDIAAAVPAVWEALLQTG